MKRQIITMMLSLLTLTTWAQSKFNVHGSIIEKGTSEAIVAATVRILSLPDSSLVAGTTTDATGSFNLKNVKKGKYAFKITYIGYADRVMPLDLTSKKSKDVDMGYLTIQENSKMLREATVTGMAAQVQVSGDSLVYNASAFRVAEGSALEELVKKLPGAEIDDDGNITINGKSVKKILLDGKEFFLNDKNIALKNIPTNIIDRIKTYDRKSDLARVTGIDDGEEETVIDLQVKKGMNQGWFGNIDLSYGTRERYSERLMLNRFTDSKQFSLVGSINNTGDRGFGGGGGRGGWGRGGNGLRTSANTGFNFATTSEKLETGGNVRFRYDGSDVVNKSNTQNFVTQSGAFTNSISTNKSNNKSVNADFRFEWKPDSMTNIIFRPSGSLSWNKGFSNSERATFNENVAQNDRLMSKYGSALGYAEAWIGGGLSTDSIFNAIVNTNNTRQMTYSTNRNINGELQLNRKFNNEGRNLTLRITGGASGSDSEQLSASNISYSNFLNTKVDHPTATNNNRYYKTPGRNSNINAQVTYSEPIADRTYLQFSYRFEYRYQMNDRKAGTFADELNTYNLIDQAIAQNRYNVAGALDQLMRDHALAPDNNNPRADSLSQYSQYRNYNHTATISFRRVREAYNLSLGVDLLPQHSTLNYRYMGKAYPTVTRDVLNFAPNVDFRYNFNKQTQLRTTYRGRSSQPSMTNLLEITDDSDPLNISMGNAGLKPSFAHNFNINFNTYNADLQQGIFSFGGANLTQNSISNETKYDAATGVRTTRPENINGNWNANLGFGYNRGLGAKKYFTVNNFTMLNYNHQVSYYYAQSKELMQQYNLQDPASIKSKTNQLGINERLSFGFRKDWFEVSINGNMNYNHSRNNVVTNSNLDTWTFGYGVEFNLNMPWGTSLSTDLSQSSRRGFSTASMNTNELLWNAQISHSFLKGRALTVSLQWNDILAQRSNISRTLTAMQSSDSEYNSIYSYGMIHVIYKLNIFGGKNAKGPEGRGPWGGGPGGRPGGERGGRGGFGGGRPW